MKIYFTRHGETEWNSRDIICGVTDIDLSCKGREQARALADSIAAGEYGIERIICSPMKRAKETADIINSGINVPVSYDDRLREWDYGSYESKSRKTPGFKEAKLEFGCRMPEGGESVFDVVNRVYGLLDELIAEGRDGTVLLVCHGGVCRVIETYYRDMTRLEFSQFFMGNCELRSFEK